MSRVHDMGGRFGDGPVLPEPGQPVFSEEWHKRALAVTLAAGALGKWNLDVMRHARERLSPKDYTRFSYYEKWLAALADQLVEQGVVTRAELAGGDVLPSDLAARVLTADAVEHALSKGSPVDRPSGIAPLFEAGDAVRTLRPAGNRKVPGGHTRLPSYAAGARGRVIACHGSHVLPDTHAHGLGEAPEPLYSVAFPAFELWTDPEHPRDEVMVDLWQSYLEPA